MKPISKVIGRMAPLYRPDIDTDQIIPKQFMKRIERTGFGPFLFYNWAHLESGEPDVSFVLNKDQYRGAKIIVAGANFGCGSSREHAVWALQDHGFEAIIAPSFADIFYNNASKVGLVCATLNDHDVRALVERAEQDPSCEVTIDVDAQLVIWKGPGSEERVARFEMEPFIRQRLLNGWDDIALTEQLMDEITKFELSRSSDFPSIASGSADSQVLRIKSDTTSLS